MNRDSQPSQASTSEHYLKSELYELVRSNDSLFEFLQAGSLDGVWYWDLTRPEHEWMSARFWETFGYDPKKMKHLAAEWQDMIHPDDLQTALENFHQHCADPDHPYDQLVRYTHRNGSTVWVRCRGIAIRDENGTPIRMLGAHNDVTEIMRLRDEQQELIETLEWSNRSLRQYAYVSSHDLQEPLRSVSSFASLLERKYKAQLDEEGQSYLKRILDGAVRMKRLIEALLEHSSIGESSLALADVDIAAVVEGLLVDFAALLDRTNGEILAEDLPVAKADTLLLTQVLKNLIGNALKYHGADPPRVTVTASRHEDEWVITVSDNGIGIAPEYQERIFEAFKRLHVESEYEGTGIGLAVCERAVRKWGGRIWVESTLGCGSAFHFTLPIPRAESL